MSKAKPQDKTAGDQTGGSHDSAKAYAVMLRYLFVSGIVVAAAFLVRVLLWNGATAFELCIFAGVLGAIMSNLVRVRDLTGQPKVIAVEVQDNWDRLDIVTYALVPIVVGAISAGVMYALLASGVIEGGAFFPKFGCLDDSKCQSFAKFTHGAFGPVGGDSHAKLLIWAFLSGFAERLVPDKLKGLVGG